MKHLPLRVREIDSPGFTLVELLVVMAIIAILAAAVLGIGNSVINSAKRAKANNAALQIQTAALNYYSEYSVYPMPSTATGDTLIGDSSAADGASWQNLICCLAGNIHPSDGTAFTVPASGPTNTRAIAFLTLKSSDVFTATDVANNPKGVQDAPKNPLPTSSSANLFYNIAMDGDYSGVIGDSTSAQNGKLPNFQKSTNTTMDYTGTTTAGIAVWANCNGGTSTNPNFWVKTY